MDTRGYLFFPRCGRSHCTKRFNSIAQTRSHPLQITRITAVGQIKCQAGSIITMVRLQLPSGPLRDQQTPMVLHSSRSIVDPGDIRTRVFTGTRWSCYLRCLQHFTPAPITQDITARPPPTSSAHHSDTQSRQLENVVLINCATASCCRHPHCLRQDNQRHLDQAHLHLQGQIAPSARPPRTKTKLLDICAHLVLPDCAQVKPPRYERRCTAEDGEVSWSL